MSTAVAQVALEIVNGLALVSVVAFIVVYSTVYRWWKAPLGRTLMAGGVAVGFVVLVGVVRRFDKRNPDINVDSLLEYSSMVAYLAIALVWAAKTGVILIERRRAKTLRTKKIEWDLRDDHKETSP